MTTPKPLAVAALIAVGFLAVGCTQPSPMQRAWDNCLKITTTAFTDGDADEARIQCQQMRDASSEEEFIDSYGDLYE